MRLPHPFAVFKGWETRLQASWAFPKSVDALNRIQAAYTQGANWGEQFTIDAWGNLTNKSSYLGKTNYESLSVSATTQNRLTGFTYDPAGDQ